MHVVVVVDVYRFIITVFEVQRRETKATELADAGEALEAELETLKQQLRAATSELDVVRGRSAEQMLEQQRVEAELTQTRNAGEASRVEAAQLRQTAEELRAGVAKQAAEVERLRAHASNEHAARVVAERDLAVAAASQAHFEARLREQHEWEQAAHRELASQRARADQVLERELRAARRARTL